MEPFESSEIIHNGKQNEFDYFMMPCTHKGEISDIMVFSWYKGETQLPITDDRLFVDTEGKYCQ